MAEGFRWRERVHRAALVLALMGLSGVPQAQAEQPPAPVEGVPPALRQLSPAAKQQLEALLPGVHDKLNALVTARRTLDGLVNEFSATKKELEELVKALKPLADRAEKSDALYAAALMKAVTSADRGAAEKAIKEAGAQAGDAKPLNAEERQRLAEGRRRAQALTDRLVELSNRLIQARPRFQKAREEVMEP